MKKTTREQETLTYIKRQLKLIFVFYSSFGDRDNYKLLKNQSFRRMLCDAQICKSEDSIKQFDIIYSRHNRNRSGLTFKEFSNILPQIAEEVYRGEGLSQKEGLMGLMKEHLFVLQEFIMTKTDLGEDVSCLKEEPDLRSFQMLLQIKPILCKIYQEYWPCQSKPTLQKCFTSLQNFLREFQLSPQLVNKSVAHIIFQEINSKESQHAFLDKFSLQSSNNKLFGFKKFISFLIDLALVGARKYAIQDQSQTKKIIHVLQRMQLSSGFGKIEKLIQSSQIRPTLLVELEDPLPTPSKSKHMSHFESQYNSNNKSVDLLQYFSSQTLGRSRHPSNNITISGNSPDRRRPSFFDFSQQESAVISKHYQDLISRFEVFCSYGETLNTITLKSIKLSKILKEIGLLGLIQQSRLDLIISNLARSSSTGKIEFPQFLKILSEMADKIQMPFQKVVICILAYEGEAGELARKLDERTASLVGRQDEEIYVLLDKIQKPLKLYFDFYSKDKTHMGFVEFSKFMYDFELFPLLISKPRLFQIFNQTADRSRLSEKFISFEMFKESLGLCSLEIIDSRLRKVEKLLLLLQRMNDSNGPKLVLKSIGTTRNTFGLKIDFLGQVRKKYSSFYQREIFNQRSGKKTPCQNFDSIILDM